MKITMQDTYNELKENRKMLSKMISALQKVNRKLAAAEQEYKKEFASECIRIKLNGVGDGKGNTTAPVAWTMTNQIARGLESVAKLRYNRDVLKGEHEAVKQKIYQVKIEIDILQKEMEAIRKGE